MTKGGGGVNPTFQVVFRPTARLAVLDSLHQDIDGLSQMSFREGGFLLFAQGNQLVRSPFPRFKRDFPVESGGGRTRPLAVREDVQVAEGIRLDQPFRLFEQGLGLARKPGDEIRPQSKHRHLRADRVQRPAQLRDRVSAPHPFQDGIRTALQGEVEEIAETWLLRHERRDLAFALSRFERTEPDAPVSRTFRQGAEKVGERLALVLVEGEVAADDDDFLKTLRDAFPRFVEARRERAASRRPPRVGYDAVGAETGTAVLHLEQGAVELCPVCGRGIRRTSLAAFRQFGQHGGYQRVAPVPVDNQVHPQRGERFRLCRFGGASGEDQEDAGVLAPEGTGEAETFVLGGLRHRAGVDDDDVRRFPERDGGNAGLGERLLEPDGLRPV